MEVYEIDGVLYVPGPDALPEFQLFSKIMGATQSYALTAHRDVTFCKTDSGERVRTSVIIDTLLGNGYTAILPTKVQVRN